MIRIVVFGRPAPAGSKRYLGTTKTGRGILAESSEHVKPWREAVKTAALEQCVDMPTLDEPLHVRMVFTLPKPAGAPKTRMTWPCRKPDISKLVRATEDSLTDAGIYADDARIVFLGAWKTYPGQGVYALDRPGCVIEIRPINESNCEP